MFTGIIEEIGKITNIKKGPKSAALTIEATKVLEDTKLGDSIATNGVCLTVTNLNSHSFTVDVMNETLLKTNFKDLQTGSHVNLERALTLNTRLGGHMVSGHIDGVGIITEKRQDDIATRLTIYTPSALLRYIIPKGSIAIDGISLTVIDVLSSSFTVSLIPHTKSETTLISKSQGESVNLECDIIGKYVEKLLKKEPHEGLTEERLKDYGYE